MWRCKIIIERIIIKKCNLKIYLQAVIERQIIEAEKEAAKSPVEQEVFYLEVAKMVVILVSLVSV